MAGAGKRGIAKEKKVNGIPKLPSGVMLRGVLEGHTDPIGRIDWSPDGRLLASPSRGGNVKVWDWLSGKQLRAFEWRQLTYCVAWSPRDQILAIGGESGIQMWDTFSNRVVATLKVPGAAIGGIAWSPSGEQVAGACSDGSVRLWNYKNQKEIWVTETTAPCPTVKWSPTGSLLAIGSFDRTVRVLNADTGKVSRIFDGHSGKVYCVCWSPDGRTLASASADRTICLWSWKAGRQIGVLEGHTGRVSCVSFSARGHLLASKSNDGTVRLWRCRNWEQLAVLPEASLKDLFEGLAFHPSLPVLATLGEKANAIRVWDLKLGVILGAKPPIQSVYYTNAKAVLVGDTGVGKSGLALVLTGKRYRPTTSTHGRRVWSFARSEVKANGDRTETREVLLWDLAGQPGYRLIHQLHLKEVAVALVVFDARSETDPFAGVHHWARALRQAQRIQGRSALPLKKFLVAARTDRGGVGVSQKRIKLLMKQMGFDKYFETSAQEGLNITDLAKAIRAAISWKALPRVSSTRLFQRIKAFLIREKSGPVVVGVG